MQINAFHPQYVVVDKTGRWLQSGWICLSASVFHNSANDSMF